MEQWLPEKIFIEKWWRLVKLFPLESALASGRNGYSSTFIECLSESIRDLPPVQLYDLVSNERASTLQRCESISSPDTQHNAMFVLQQTLADQDTLRGRLQGKCDTQEACPLSCKDHRSHGAVIVACCVRCLAFDRFHLHKVAVRMPLDTLLTSCTPMSSYRL